MSSRGSTCKTRCMPATNGETRPPVAADAAVGPDGPVLWVEMEKRRKALRIKAEVLHHAQTRAKIRDGRMVRSDVTDDLDRDLHWVTGSAERAQRQGIPPDPLEGSQDATAQRLSRKLAVIADLNRVAMMLADSPDDVPEHVLRDARRKAEEIAESIRRERQREEGGTERRR
jgi:hypothetical protein